MQSVNAILAFTLQIYGGKIISKKIEKPLDKSRQVWYTIIAVSESEAVKSSQEHRKKNFKIFSKTT